MRKIIAALQVSLDGFIEGLQGELDWVEALFKDVKQRQALQLIHANPLKSGKVGLTYSTQWGVTPTNGISGKSARLG